MHRLARAAPINADRQQTNRKKNQGHDCKPPVHQKENGNSANDGDWLLKQVAAYSGQRHLHAARVIGDARYEKSSLHFIKELHRVPHNFAEELVPDVGHHFVGHPVHAIRVAVRTEAAHRHDRRNGEADKKERIDFGTRV